MLFAKVVLALMLGRPAERYLDAQRGAHLQRMRELTELKRTASLVDALLADHGLFHLEADLRWIDMTAARLDALAQVVRPSAAETSPGVTGDPAGSAVSAAAVSAASARQGCLIEARDVVLSFGQTPALRGASVSVAAGEILAVMGPSGSGKSTLLHCLAGILTPDAGEVWFDGRRVDTLGETERSALRRDRFGFVFQFGQLVPELTAEENVALPLLLGGARRAAALAEARAWFGRLGLDGLEQRRPVSCPAAQAQRVALARGLVARPEVLFADEPTGSLDSLTGEHVMKLLTAAAREQGTTVVLVTHEPRVAAYADREVIVRDGKVTSLSPGPGRLDDPPRPAPDPARRPGGGRPAGRHRAAVALGVGLLLITLAGINAVNAQNARYAWLSTGVGRTRTGARPDRRPGSRPRASRDSAGPAVVAAQRRRLRRPGSSTGSTSPPPGPAHRSRPASRTCPDPGSSTPRRRSAGCSAPPRPASSATASRHARSAPSARRRCRRRTR